MEPRILLDARLAARGLGIGTFVDRLLQGFRDAGGPVPVQWRAASEGGGLRSVAGRSGLFDVSPRLDPRSRGFDVVHFACNVGPLFPGRSSVLTVHDLLHRRSSRARYKVLGALLERSIPRAGQVVAISSHTADEVAAAFPGLAGRIEVIPHGMRRLDLPDRPREHLLSFGGGADPRKRIGLMVEAYRSYRATTPDPLPLIVLARAGLTPVQRQELLALGAEVVGDAGGPQVDEYLAGAAALLYTTLDEGFGLPILEAAEAGTPVVLDAAARVAAEVVGEHCVRVDGAEPASWAEGIRIAAKMGRVEGALELDDWAGTARRYLDVYSRVLS